MTKNKRPTRCILKNKDKQKPQNVDYFRVPRPLWRRIKKHLPKPPQRRGPGRPRADNRAVVNGLWYILWTGCQWKAIHRDWFGVSSSVLHERFQTWQQQGIWDKVLQTMVRFYNRQRRIRWKWQAIDSKSVPAPLGGEATGRNPTDRGKRGPRFISWLMSEARRWQCILPVLTSTTNGRWTTWSSPLWSHVRQKNSIFVWIKGMISTMSTVLLPKSIIRNISPTVGVVANHCQNQFLKIRSIRHDDGSWKGRLVGWPKGVVFALGGARKVKIGWPLCSSLVRISCAI
ncbi:MAG: transposase [Anaerolineaceae bacterium]|nr:transposase [Anaerolineaceae bacterium]